MNKRKIIIIMIRINIWIITRSKKEKTLIKHKFKDEHRILT